MPSSAVWNGPSRRVGDQAPDRRWFHDACGLADVDGSDAWLNEVEAERIASFRFEKRRSETRMSRWTAKRTVAAALGLPADEWLRSAPEELRRIGIRNAPTGAPVAFVDDEPAPVSISMTDRADWAVCVVALDATLRVGCDLELVEPRTTGFVADWFTESERTAVARSDPADHDLLANLIWSAKESALKVLQTGLRRDTRSVDVHLDPGADPVAGWRPLRVTSLDPDDDAAASPGWWRRFGEFVLTCAADAPLGPPISLADPPALETATPSHAWLDQHR